MHIVVLTPYFPPMVSGAGSYLADVADGLVAAGHRVTVLLAQGEPGTRQRGPVTVETVRSRVRGATSVKLAIRSLQVHRRDRVDLFVAGLAHPTGFVTMLAATLARRPLAVIALGEDVSIGHTSTVARLCLRETFRRSRIVVALSEFTEAEVTEIGRGRARCSIVPPGIDPAPFVADRAEDRARFRERLGLGDRCVILTVARLEERKGHDTVLAAIHRLHADHPDLHYLIVGQGDDRRLRDMAKGWHLEDRLTIIPYLSNDDLPDAYAAADVFAMLSRPGPQGEVDGFGIVYLEAAASGLPCLAGSLGGCGDAVADGVTGCCVDPRDVDAAAQGLRSILGDPVRAGAMDGAAETACSPRSPRQRFGRTSLRCSSAPPPDVAMVPP